MVLVRSGGLTLDLRDARKRPKSSSALVVAPTPHPRSECRVAWGDVEAASTKIGEVLTSHKRPRPTVVEEKLDVQAHVAAEVERETKSPAAGRLVSSISCQHVPVIAMPSDVLVDAARHHGQAGTHRGLWASADTRKN